MISSQVGVRNHFPIFCLSEREDAAQTNPGRLQARYAQIRDDFFKVCVNLQQWMAISRRSVSP
jgi:hypothetical protein